MTYVIGSACIGTTDRSCVDVCPVDCIHEVAQMLVIDPGECIDCSLCEPACPVSAITPAEGVAPEDRPFIEINAAWPDGAEAVDQLVAEFQAAGSRLGTKATGRSGEPVPLAIFSGSAAKKTTGGRSPSASRFSRM